jgi:hypothetical protein
MIRRCRYISQTFSETIIILFRPLCAVTCNGLIFAVVIFDTRLCANRKIGNCCEGSVQYDANTPFVFIDVFCIANELKTKTGAVEHPFFTLFNQHTTHSTKKSRIMPMSSCSRLWQWYINKPLKSWKGFMIRTFSPGITSTVSFRPLSMKPSCTVA